MYLNSINIERMSHQVTFIILSGEFYIYSLMMRFFFQLHQHITDERINEKHRKNTEKHEEG